MKGKLLKIMSLSMMLMLMLAMVAMPVMAEEFEIPTPDPGTKV